jgi:hypothetical protein
MQDGRKLMKLFRYRRPSVNQVLGITKAKRRMKKASGYYTLTKPMRMKTNLERQAKSRIGYYHPLVRFLRNLFRFRS